MKMIFQIIVMALFPIIAFGALTVNNGGGATNITATSAWISATISSTGAANPTLYSYWGTNDGSTSAASWKNTNSFGASTQGAYSFQATGLSGSTIYYHRTFATNSTETDWASYSAQFITLTTPTSAPPSSVRAVTVSTNGVLKNPANFFSTNALLIHNALAPYGYLTNEAGFLAWLPTNTYVQSNTGNWDGTWQGLGTNDLPYDPAGSAGAVQTDLNDHKTNTGVHAISAVVDLQATLDDKVNTNHTGNVSVNGVVDVYVGRRTSTNEDYELPEFVAYSKMRSEIAQSSALSIYANTNAHPVIAGVTILSREIPDAWCTTNTYSDAGTYLVATRLYTNYVNQLRFGKYIADAAAYKDGLSDLKLYLELITTDGATTNVLSTSIPGKSLTTIESISRLLCGLETNRPVAAGFYFGYNLYAIKTGSPGVDLILCGGKGSLTSLSTPGLAAADGVIVEVDPVASTNLANHIADTANPHEVTAAQVGAASTQSFVGVSNDVAALKGGSNLYIAADNTLSGQLVSAYSLASVARTMTNYVHVPSSTNYYIYNPATRTASGCSTNAGGGGAGSGFPLTNNVSLAGFTMSNGTFVGNLAGSTNLTGYVPTNDVNLLNAAEKALATNTFQLIARTNAQFLTNGTTVYLDVVPDPYDDTAMAAATNLHRSQILALQGSTSSLNIAAGNLNAATQAINIVANAALPKSVTNALAVTALQVTSGNPTNGAVFIATNNAGQGTWTVFPKIWANRVTPKNFPVGNSQIIYTNLVNKIGGEWDGTYWTPGIIGQGSIKAMLAGDSYIIPAGRSFGWILYQNNFIFMYDRCIPVGGVNGYSQFSGSFLFYNLNATNKYDVRFQVLDVAITNDNSTGIANAPYFVGTMLP